MKLACKELIIHLDQRLELDKQMIPMRMHRLFDEFNSFLRQRKKIDVFDLLVELILHADNEPAQDMCALLAVLDSDALLELEQFDVVNAATFIRDAMRKESVRWYLQDCQTQQTRKKKKRKD